MSGNKFLLRVSLSLLVLALLLTALAGCGVAPEQSDPDVSDYVDVSEDTTAPVVDTTENDTTTTIADGDTTTEADVPTLEGEASTTTGDKSSTAAGSKNESTTTANSTTVSSTTVGSTTIGGSRPGLIIKTTGTKTSATSVGATTSTTVENQLGGEGADLSTDEVVDRNKFKEQNKNLPMPTRKLANNVVTVFSWRDQQSDNCYGGSKPDLRPVYKDVGLETKWYQATHDNYMDALAAVVASGSAPDLVEWNSTKMYPAAIASGLVVPMDPYVNWDDDIWDDVRSLTAKYQINGKTFFSVEYMQIAELLYYDPTIIKAAGLETPLELWRKDKWTLKALQNIADKTVQIDKEGNVTRYGFVPGNIGAITGLEMVEYNRARGYKLNITNSKYKTLMNIMYQMGVNGTRSAGFTTPGNVGNGSVVMAMTVGWNMNNGQGNEARKRGQLEWCVIPKLDDSSEHYYNLTMQQTFGVLKGAKNPEGGAYLIELRKWAFLNYPWLETLPFTDTAYTRTYGEKLQIGNGGDATLTEKEIAYSTELLSKDYDVVANNLWGGWVGNGQFPGITEVISNGNAWSTVLANRKATMEAVLKQWDFSNV